MSADVEADVAAVQAIEVVPTMLDTLCRLTGMRFAAVARVTEGRWVACDVRDDIDFGLKPGGELKVETTICHEIRATGREVVIDDVDADPVYAAHHTPKIYGLKSYISVPIMLRNGSFFGTLCAIDPRPNILDRPEILNTFRMFANLIAFHLDSGERLDAAEDRLLAERRTAKLREQFIAVLGHDLRNPLASLTSGVSLVEREPQTDKARKVLSLMRQSAERMSLLIDNVLDFARGRLGGGLAIDRRAIEIAPLIRQVVGEIQSVDPGRSIIVTGTAPDDRILCDPGRIAQLVSNLVGNAISHGDRDKPIHVRYGRVAGRFELSVCNAGQKIADDALGRLFEPFERGAGGRRRDGLGLGLFISAEIARAHGGTLTVSSTTEETRFTFGMSADAESATRPAV